MSVTKLEVVGSKLEPNDETIRRLDELLEKARTGDLRSFLFVGLRANGGTWEADNGVPGDSFYALLGAAYVFMRRQELAFIEGTK